MDFPHPIFQNKLPKISWKKIYDREYGVQYSEIAVSIFSTAKDHFPKTSTDQIIIPGEGSNTAFYIDDVSWIELVEGLNNKYTANVKKLSEYEKQFVVDGNDYLNFAKKIGKLELKSFSDQELLDLYLQYQKKRDIYTVFIWSAFILNNYVADRATAIIDEYVKKHRIEDRKNEIIDSLFKPEKLAAILQLQYEVEKHKGKLSDKLFEDLYERFKWFSCLDIHNKPWTKEEFEKHIEPFTVASTKKITPFEKFIKELKFAKKDLEYLLMAKRFVYIKDARDDFRRESVFYSSNLFAEIARRIGIDREDTSYLQEQEIADFLSEGKVPDKNIITQRKKGFVMYLDNKGKIICLSGDQIKQVLKVFKLLSEEEKPVEIVGRVASQGKTKGIVSIVYGVKDLKKVKAGHVLVAVATHPDYVPAMRKAIAIITDEGGITSHAAIVAREFGIPCIVGSKNATKLLKDGDLVSVDAVEGKVIKIS